MKIAIGILGVFLAAAAIAIICLSTTVGSKNEEIRSLREVKTDLIKISTVALAKEKEDNLPLERVLIDWRGTAEYKGIFGDINRVPVLNDDSVQGIENTILEIYMYNNSQFKKKP